MRYEKRISSEEARGGFILILKDNLRDFPPVGTSFPIMYRGIKYTSRVNSINCTCAGPKKPHQHYHLIIRGVRPVSGKTAVIEGDPPTRLVLAMV
jgi:hypothetical protein